MPAEAGIHFGQYMHQYYVYILASQRHGTLYTGVTGDLVGRVYQHKEKVTGGFTDRYDVKQLVWFEIHEDIHEAIRREKQIKAWQRAWKIRLIEESNPKWEDLWGRVTGEVAGE